MYCFFGAQFDRRRQATSSFAALRALILILLFPLFLAPARAQFRASIQGVVTDSTGAVIPGATLTLTNLQTNEQRTTTSNGEGIYNFNALPPDNFSLVVERDGFQKKVFEHLQLIPEQANSVNVQLTIGAAATTVTVNAESATVLDKETAKRCLDAGAKFLTSTGLVPDVVESALAGGIVAIPGALTPTEVIAAWKAGAQFVKIYPAAPVGGALYIRSLKVPLPQVKLIAAGGVNQQNATAFIAAGASAIGVGVELLPRDAVLRRQDHRIHELARRFLGFVAEARVTDQPY